MQAMNLASPVPSPVTPIVAGPPREDSEGKFYGVVLSDPPGHLPAIQSVMINPAITLPGINSSRLSFDTNSITLNARGITFDAGRIVLLNPVIPTRRSRNQSRVGILPTSRQAGIPKSEIRNSSQTCSLSTTELLKGKLRYGVGS